MLTHILFRSAIDNSQLLLRQPYVLIGNVFKNRIELTVNVNTLFHGDVSLPKKSRQFIIDLTKIIDTFLN